MLIPKSDIRIAGCNINIAAKKIKEYAVDSQFEIVKEKITANSIEIKTQNEQNSIFGLYWSNRPQIIHWYLKNKSEGVEIEIKSDLFEKFRIAFYFCLCSLLTGFFLFLTGNQTFFFNSVMFQKNAAFSNIPVAIFILIVSFIFFLRSLNSEAYSNYVNQFYKNMRRETAGKESVIKKDLGFPDTWKGMLVFFAYFGLALYFSNNNIPEYEQLSSFYFTGTIIISVLIGLLALLFLMSMHPAVATRVIFVLIGLGLCVPVAIYINIPAELSFFGDIHGKLATNSLIVDGQELTQGAQDFILKISWFYFTAVALALFIPIILIFNVLWIPARIIKDIRLFPENVKDSDYTRALHPDNIPTLFNILIFFLWTAITCAIFSGLFFSVSLVEMALFKKNYLFHSEPAILFFENTKITFSVLLRSDPNAGSFLFLHASTMIIYATPILIFLFLIFKKKLRKIHKGYHLLKTQWDTNPRIMDQVEKKVKRICDYAGTRMPIIKISESPSIYAETRFLGFPFFKNILIISAGACEELKDLEQELEILIAHEVWHIKKHNVLRKILCVLSDYSLFGNGFLALLQNSYQIEKEADAFAVKWVSRKTDRETAVRHLKSLLERIEEYNWINSVLQSGESLNFSMFKKDAGRKNFFKKFKESSWIKKFQMNLHLLFQIYFGNEIQSYFHPSLNQRILWAKDYD